MRVVPVTHRAGFLYAVEFDNGTIKVGWSGTPESRIKHHEAAARGFQISSRRTWISERIGDCRGEETRWLERIHERPRHGRALSEWVSGMDFDAVVALARSQTRSIPREWMDRRMLVTT